MYSPPISLGSLSLSLLIAHTLTSFCVSATELVGGAGGGAELEELEVLLALALLDLDWPLLDFLLPPLLLVW